MKKIIYFSKSYDNEMLEIKKDFYLKNDYNFKKIKKINNLYKKEPKRKNCQNCEKKIGLKDFSSFEIDYIICKNCSHLNGKYENSDRFAYNLYRGEKSKLYSLNYEKDYERRVDKIYQPKVKFLKKVLKKKFTLTDICSGAGHFLKALELDKVKSTGYETSKHLVKLSKNFLKINNINLIKFNKIYETIENSKTTCISLIGVLEHLCDPNLAIRSFKKSKAKYLYISVPLFSFSSILEHANPKIYPRQLGGSHTHLYTKQSLDFLLRKYNLSILGEWWFGTDIADLHRILLSSSSKKNSKFFYKFFNLFFTDYMNDFQKVLDKNKVCSEVHLVIKK